MTSSEHFIRQVFAEMVKCKPKLAAFLDEDDDDFDIRELSNNIAKMFPWPVGIELRRLLSGNMEKLDRGRLDQILKTIERTMHYLAFVLTIQLLEEVYEGKLEVDEKFKKEFPRRFTTLSMGNFAWLIRSVSNLIKSNKLSFFMEECEGVMEKEFFKQLDFWVPERNDIGHYLINLTEEEIEVRCSEYMEKLQLILSRLAFLIKYPLVTITEVQLIKRKREQEHFSHNMLLLNSASSSFLGKIQDFDNFTDTHSVILVKSIKNAPNQFLNLSPLIIDTHFEVMETREKLTKLKKDVYLYSKWDKRNQRLSYVGTEATEKMDVRLLSFYDQLVIEFDEIMSVFSIPEPVESEK